MKISEAIKYLQEYQDQDQEIVIAWWDHLAFMELQDMSPAEASEVLGEVDRTMDWSYAHEALADTIQDIVG
jgi:hypothetical protein